MSELYLILHKVRGEPAFDIAQKLTIGDEEGWIIPTSGHRAYPANYWNLDDLACIDDYPHVRPVQADAIMDDLPDHYEVNSEPRAILTSASALLAKLGLTKPKPKIEPNRRRICT